MGHKKWCQGWNSNLSNSNAHVLRLWAGYLLNDRHFIVPVLRESTVPWGRWACRWLTNHSEINAETEVYTCPAQAHGEPRTVGEAVLGGGEIGAKEGFPKEGHLSWTARVSSRCGGGRILVRGSCICSDTCMSYVHWKPCRAVVSQNNGWRLLYTIGTILDLFSRRWLATQVSRCATGTRRDGPSIKQTSHPWIIAGHV